MRRPIILVSSTGNISSSFRKVFLVPVKFNVHIKWIHTLIHSLHSVFRTFVFIWMTFYDRPRAELRSTLRTNITGNERKKKSHPKRLAIGFFSVQVVLLRKSRAARAVKDFCEKFYQNPVRVRVRIFMWSQKRDPPKSGDTKRGLSVRFPRDRKRE